MEKKKKRYKNRGFGPKPGMWYTSCWTGFSLLKCSVLQWEAFFEKKKGLKGPNCLPTAYMATYVYIYIQSVKLRMNPKCDEEGSSFC